MIQANAGPKSGENSWLWLYKLVSGLFIIIILFIHLGVNHFVAEGGLLTYDQIVAYYRSPIIPIMETAFLIFVVSHSMIGLRSIILDLKPSRGVLKAIDWVLTIAGIGFVIYGYWLIQVIVGLG